MSGACPIVGKPILLRLPRRARDGSGRVRAAVTLKSPEELARAISIEKAHLPTDERGNADLRRIADTLILPGGPGHFILSLLGRGAPPVNPYVPYRHQTL